MMLREFFDERSRELTAILQFLYSSHKTQRYTDVYYIAETKRGIYHHTNHKRKLRAATVYVWNSNQIIL